MPDEATVVIEVFGEGKTDIGQFSDVAELADRGVVPILLRKLCGEPPALRVRRKQLPQMAGRSLEQKVKFSKRQAYYNGSAGIVFVVDTEGEAPDKHLRKLRKGRDEQLAEYPAVVGVAHPCIETWLLNDAKAVQRAFGLRNSPALPAEPEALPAPQHDRGNNPKVELAKCVNVAGEVAAKDAFRIAEEIRDLAALRSRCPQGFAPFADEVESRIRPLFEAAGTAGETSD